MIRAWPNVRRLSAVALLATASCCLSNPSHAADVKVSPVRSAGPEASTADTYYLSARTAIDRRDYATALELLQVARARSPDDIRILNAFGVVYDKLGRFDLSARYYAQAGALDPASPIVAQNLAYSLALQGQAASPPNPVRMAATGAAQAQLAKVPTSAPAEGAIASTDSVTVQNDGPTREGAAINSTIVEVIATNDAAIQPVSMRRSFQPSAAELRSWSPTLVRISTPAVEAAEATNSASGHADSARPTAAPPQQGWVAERVRVISPTPVISAAAETSTAAGPNPPNSTIRVWTPAASPASDPPKVTLMSSPVADAAAAITPSTEATAGKASETPSSSDAVGETLQAIAKAGALPDAVTTATWPGTSEPRPEPKWVSAAHLTPEGHRVVVMPSHPGKALLTGDHAPSVQVARLRPVSGLIIVNASGSADQSAHIRDGLLRLRWSRPSLFAAGDRKVGVTTLAYPASRAKVARALARSLPGRVRLVACRTPCQAMRLVLGTDSRGWRSMDIQAGVQHANTVRPISKHNAGHQLSTASSARPKSPEPDLRPARVAQRRARPWKLQWLLS